MMSDEQPIPISQNYIDDSPYWEYHTYGEGVLEAIANRISKQAEKCKCRAFVYYVANKTLSNRPFCNSGINQTFHFRTRKA